MAKGTEVAARKNTLPANWEAQMKLDAEKGRKQVAAIGVSRRLKTRGGVLQYMDQQVPGNKMPVVVLYAGKENAFYEGEFDADNPTSPVCFSFASQDDDEKDMVPHPESQKKQHDNCHKCPKNQWNSAEKGRGKACKNTFQLSVIHADALKSKKAGVIADAEVVTASVPPTSLGAYAGHVKQIEKLSGKPVYGFVTELGLTGNPKGGFNMTFTTLDEVRDKKLLGEIFLRSKDAEKESAERPPYQPIEPLPAKAGARKGLKGQGAAAKTKKGK